MSGSAICCQLAVPRSSQHPPATSLPRNVRRTKISLLTHIYCTVVTVSHFLLTALREFSSYDSPTCINCYKSFAIFSGHHLGLLYTISCIASHLPLRRGCLHNNLEVRTLPEYDRPYVRRPHTAIFRCSANVEIQEGTAVR